MQLLHLFYSTQHGFNNHGTLNFWVESSQASKSLSYSYQIRKELLLDLANELFCPDSALSVDTCAINIPCNKSGNPIPSPIIANINNISDRQIVSFKPFKIHVVKLANSIPNLKQLHFKSHYFEKNRQLAADAHFWVNITNNVCGGIKKNQYIPELVAEDAKETKYHTRWGLISSEFHETIRKQVDIMPYSAFFCKSLDYDRRGVIEHYANNVLNQLIKHTPITNRLHKLVEGTFVDDALTLSTSNQNEGAWKQWKLWRNNLSYDQFGSPFQLCFRLNAARDERGDDWSLEILMQSKDQPSFMVNASEYWKTQKQKQAIYNKMFGTSAQKTLLLQLGYASRVLPLIEMFFQFQMSRELLPISTELAFQFLKEDAWALKASGYKIIIPSWWTAKGRLRAKVKLQAKSKSNSEGDSPNSYFDRSGLVQFNYKLAIGEHQVSAAEWEALIGSSSDLIFFRGEWVELDMKEMQKIQSLVEQANSQSDIGTIKDLLIKAADDELYDVELDDQIQKTLDQLTGKSKLIMLKAPSSLKATLRPYQLRGLSWMAFLEKIGLAPCLADDMGLGKTMQVISLLLAQPGSCAALLVAPTSVIGNWEREVKKFAPTLKTMIHHGATRSNQDQLAKALNEVDIVITSFALCRKDQAIFQSQNWSRVIVDEAQNIKNPSAAQTKAICKLNASSRIALTGTPIENRLTDLWSIFHYLNPGYLGTKSYFKRAFEFPVQRDNNPYRTKMLKGLVEPLILRRLKTDKNIIKDLPDKIEQKVYCQLTKEQAAIYQNIVDDVKAKMAQVETKQDERALVLSSLLRLKQTCNHPAQVLQDGSEFSIGRSMKLKRTVDLVTEIMAANESVLIFSQFTEICEQLEAFLRTKCAYNTFYLHGGTSRTKRESMIQEFQRNESPPAIFILSLKAGGVGITLTKANHVIHFDRWWNPAVENQATDRAYRIGQEKTVFAHKFVTTGTLEERIDQMIDDKQKVSDMIVGNDESWLSKLDSKSFLDLIKLSQDEISRDNQELEEAENEVALYDE